jgi:FkbM family methyltransferase
MALNGQHAELLLQRALRRASPHRSRLGRLARYPWRLLYPRLLLRTGRCHALAAATFWGGRMEIVLPEAVSTQIWGYGFFEEDVCLFLLKSLRPGMVCVDVGAHFGFFALLASELVGAEGRVVALEPMPETFARLARNVAVHGSGGNITPLQSAAYSAVTTLTFQDYGPVYSAFNSAFDARLPRGLRFHGQVHVAARTCDDLIGALALSRVDLIKIDAESSELHVLRGAQRTLDRFRPRIIVEVGDFGLPGVASSSELVQSLLGQGYRAYERLQFEVTPHAPRTTYDYGNLLFVPDEARHAS